MMQPAPPDGQADDYRPNREGCLFCEEFPADLSALQPEDENGWRIAQVVLPIEAEPSIDSTGLVGNAADEPPDTRHEGGEVEEDGDVSRTESHSEATADEVVNDGVPHSNGHQEEAYGDEQNERRHRPPFDGLVFPDQLRVDHLRLLHDQHLAGLRYVPSEISGLSERIAINT